MNMLLFLDPLAGGQKRSTSIYRAEESGRGCQSGLCWDCTSWRCPERRPLTPPLVHSISYVSVTALKRFSSGVCHRVWHWWLVGGRLGRRCVNYWADGEFLQGKCRGFHITFHLANKPRLYVCSRSGGLSIYHLLHSKGLWERTRQIHIQYISVYLWCNKSLAVNPALKKKTIKEKGSWDY